MQKIEIGSRYPLSQPEMMNNHNRGRREGAGTFTKTLLVVKLTILLLTAAFLNVHANSKAQSVTLSGKDLTLKQVFAAIEKQTDYLAFYNQQMLLNTKTVSLTVYDMPLTDLLKIVLKDQPLDFTIQGKTIILSRKKADDNPDKPLTISPPKIELFAPPVTGRILGPDGAPLSGVTVSIKGTAKGTSTIANGAFSLEVKEGDMLEISSIGYTTVTLHYTGGDFKMIAPAAQKKAQKENASGKLLVASATSFTVQMMRSNSPLDEVEITAYGSTSKRLSTGSISTVKAEDIEKQPVLTVLEALVGRVPGAVVTQLSGNSAAPMNVTIRGRNSINARAIADPLYVIDGIPQTTLDVRSSLIGLPYSPGAVQAGMTNTSGENPLLRLNLRDVERIDVLKDADATAIYGSRGANGVILITLKKSKAGAARLTINVDQATKMLARYPRLLGTQEYLEVRREAFRNEGTIPDPNNAPDLTIWDPLKYTDWQRLFVGTGSATTVDASVSGGNAQSSYRISGNYNTTKEIMNNGGGNHVGSFRTSFGHTSTNQKFVVDFSNALSMSRVDAVAVGMKGSLAPNAPDIYTPEGTFNFVPYRDASGSRFPFSELRLNSESKTFSLATSINLRYEITRGLTLSATGGFQYDQNENVRFSPASAYDPLNNAGSSAVFGKSINKNWNIRPQVKYTTRISRGTLLVQLLTNMQSTNTRGETVIAGGFPNEAMMKSYTNVRNIDLNIQQGYKEYKYIGTSAIINYTWDKKYVINLNGTRDGSSRFAPGKQFGNFGSVGLAWIASEEEWLKKSLPSWFNFLKLYGSYGTTGNDGIGDYEYLSRWSKTLAATGSASNVLYSYNGVNAFHVTRPLNQVFQWETNRKSNLSVNMGFLNNKLSLDLTIYRHVSSDQLTTMATPKFTGFATALTNFDAVVENKGIEASVVAQLINTKDWNLQFNFNIGTNKNTLLEFPNLESSSYRDQLRIGVSTTSRMALRYTGIDPMTGSYTFEDYNKDGRITTTSGNFPNSSIDDRYIVVEFNPKYSGGFGFMVNYKSVSISSQFYFINKLRQDPYLSAVPGSMNNIELPDEIKNNHWKQPGDQAKYPRYVTQLSHLGPIMDADAYYVNGAYLRMTNLAIQWHLPESWTKKVKMKNASLSIKTQNLFTLSRYGGLDPEVTSQINMSPIPRTINTNLSFTF